MNLWSMDNNAQNLVLKRLLEQANKENPTVEFDIDAVAAKLSATAITLTISSFDIDQIGRAHV